jgi:hypothetical protein
VLIALSLAAAACSGGAGGQVGSSLAAMDGTVTLVKVISPATVSDPFAAQPAFGHKLVAVVLAVQAPATANAHFGAIYIDSKLVDSTNQSHPGKGTIKYSVTSCSAYVPFATLSPGQTQTGCEIFQIAAAANPVELKISGKASADWTISASAIQPGGAAIAPAAAPPVTPTAPPPTQALAATPTTTAVAPNSGTGNTGAAPNTSSKGTTGVTPAGGAGAGAGAGATTSAPPTPKAHRAHVLGGTKVPKILRVTPRGGYVGTTAQIYGKRLSGVIQVTFNGVPATIVKTLPGRIVVVVPAGATTGPIVVFMASGTLTAPRSYVVL